MVESITRVPNAPAFVDGVVFSRGQVVPAINMRARFGFERAPLDITYNLGLRVDTSVGGLTLAFSNLFGLIPARRGARQ